MWNFFPNFCMWSLIITYQQVTYIDMGSNMASLMISPMGATESDMLWEMGGRSDASWLEPLWRHIGLHHVEPSCHHEEPSWWQDIKFFKLVRLFSCLLCIFCLIFCLFTPLLAYSFTCLHVCLFVYLLVSLLASLFV